MNNFKNFVENQDIQATLRKIPSNHKKLVKGYNFKFQKNNTLKGSSQHVGYVWPKTKEIVVAAPWNYSREFTTLHEIGHLVWENLNYKQKEQWNKIVKNTKNKPKQNAEELFCMAYATTYAKHPPVSYNKKEWIDFINSIS